ncbi:serine hydrolase [Maribacter sp. PR1]|uniref:Serine hydrolase domain-containing protein n=1 Tax=Maribacter cobaltidurans TaxID=1178778 RepID=A0ABU7IPV0_9FLAO|nr:MULTISPECIES: serine hydrolase domain-containing protein [Maribacter]MDC6387606.1 serine hydrolase [Maribacter sp. PR1]MEE1974994.1 serine hydrolase domain-containing protein [Maribacter cobaltidurans]
MKTSTSWLLKDSFLVVSLAFLIFVSCKTEKKNEDNSTAKISVVTESTKKRIDSTLQAFVISGNIAGVSALIYEQGQEVYFNAFGYADKEAQEHMDRNTIVQIYSMTKPITGTALMTLYEEGKFELDDPITKYATEYSNMEVYTGVDENGNVVTEPLDRPVTIRDVTRHTAGFPNRPNIPGLSELLADADAMNRENTLTQMAEKMGGVPLWFQPGTQWEYGPSVDVQALLVERISGVPYGEYVRNHVLDPLEMTKTRYYIPEEDREDFARLYIRTGEGELVKDSVTYSNYTEHWPLTRGGSGLTSTLDDYMKFAQMLVHDGSLDSVEILKPETVKLMATNQLADSITERSWLPSKGQVGFGIDFAVRVAPPANAEENHGVVGEFYWDGAASTLFWVDPVNKLTAVMFVQLFPYDQIGLHKKFRDAVYGPYKGENAK